VNAADPLVSPSAAKYSGRATAVNDMERTLDLAGNGQAGLGLITGEAGIGRTALALEISARATGRGFTALWSTCSIQATVRPYWPWSQLVQDCLAAASPDQVPILIASIAPALVEVAPSLAASLDAPSSPQPLVDQFALFQVFARFWTVAATRQRPLLLTIDDLQWADPASIYLLTHLATTLRRAPVAMVATIRVGEPVDEPTSRALAELDRCAAVTVRLKGLPRTALADLIRANGFNPHGAVIDLLTLRTAGNPYFANEILRSLDRSAHAAVSMTALAELVPDDLRKAVLRRLALLDPVVRQFLSAASVIGPAGDLTVLAATAALDMDVVTEFVDVVADAGLLARDGPKGWRFIHTVVRDVSYRSIPAVLRRQLHERALEALEVMGAPASQLAGHAQFGVEQAELPRAIALMVRAGKEHLSAGVYGSAVDCFTRAVALGEADAGISGQAERMLLLAEACRCLGDGRRAAAAYRGAMQTAGGDPSLLGAATIGLTDPTLGVDLARHFADGGTIDLLQQAVTAMGDTETPVRARLLARLSYEFYYLGDRKRARSVVADALTMAQRIGDPAALVGAMTANHRIQVIGPTSLGAALIESAQMVELAQATGNVRLLRLAHRARVLDLLMTGDLNAVDAELHELRRVTVELGDIAAERWWIVLWRAMRALLDGRHAEAEVVAAQARQLADPASLPEAESSWLIQRVFVACEEDRLGEVGSDIRSFVSGTQYSAAIDTLTAFRAAEMGDIDEATDALYRLTDRLQDLQDDTQWPGIWFQLARIAYLVGDRSAAELLYEPGRALSGQCTVVGVGAVCVGAADLALAWLADVLGDDAEALRWYSSAEVINVRAGARSWLAQTRLDQARMLARRAGPGDLDEASRLASLAASAAARIGLRSVLASADDLLAGLTTTAAAAVPAPAATPDPTPEPGDHAGVFRRAGSVWELGYGGLTIQEPHAKGLVDLAQLLGHPGQPIHVSALVSLQAGGAVTPSGADEVFDARARQEIRQRLADLAEEAEDAEADGDLVRAERARDERAEIVASLSSALGLGGRARRLDDPMERARKTVAARIHTSINKIAVHHVKLAHHLERSVDTGLWCVYKPEQHVLWHL
jgi:tetratricopeptide (TPR) repeat protein